MTRSLVLFCLLIGAAIAWNYETGFQSQPWKLKDVWVRRSSAYQLPQLPVREWAQLMTLMHKRSQEAPRSSGDSAVLPHPTVRDNALKAGGYE
ncbi:hypothetical protein PRIPAC_97422, partial [Pristionchus pacificus]|uniref:Uncharacterized protein n=1 Tax=Pristionchus pacificus TaxID=54126 RepID=A0A2A6BXX0_PRIPA